jgi:hypothetical protein
MSRFFVILSAIAVVGVAIIAFLARSANAPAAAHATNAGATAGAPVLSQTLAGIQGVSVDGSHAPIIPQGGGVVIVALSTCPHCHKILGAFATAARGVPYAHLTVVVVDGVARGRAMVDSMRLKASVQDFGTPSVRDSLIAALKLEGVPAFFKVDASGRVLATQVGEMGLDALSPWIAAAR